MKIKKKLLEVLKFLTKPLIITLFLYVITEHKFGFIGTFYYALILFVTSEFFYQETWIKKSKRGLAI